MKAMNLEPVKFGSILTFAIVIWKGPTCRPWVKTWKNKYAITQQIVIGV